MKRTRLGTIHADHVNLQGALDAIAKLVEVGEGGYVVTPNSDHVCQAENDQDLREVYANASLSLIDGQILWWLTHLLGHPLPEKVSGSDLVGPLAAQAGRLRWRVYFLGAGPGVAQRASEIMASKYPGLVVAGVDSPPMGFDRDPAASQAVVDKIREAQPQIILVALGCPKQELWMHRFREAYAPAIALGIGASLDFVAGTAKRAPAWVSRFGLESPYRLAQEPRRLAYRYLVRDLGIFPIIGKMMLSLPKEARALEVEWPPRFS